MLRRCFGPQFPDSILMQSNSVNREGLPKRGRGWGWLSLALGIGLGLRLLGLAWGQGYFYFGQGDAIAAYSVAVDFAAGDSRAQYIGQPNYNKESKLPGPLWTLLCWAGLQLGGSIQGTILLIILLNTATIFLIYLLAERTLGSQPAIWAAMLAATLPSAVFYSVGVYNPQVMAFLGCLLFLALWQTVQRDCSRSIYWVAVLLLAMPQFHMSGLMLFLTVAMVLALSPTRINLPWLAGGLVAGAALYVPYIIGDAAHGWQNTRGMFSGGGAYSWDGLKAMTAPLNLLVSWVPQWLRTASEYRELGRACFGGFGVLLAFNLLSVLVAALLVMGAFQKIKEASSGFLRAPREVFKRSPGILFLAIVLIMPLLLALVSGKPFHTRYSLVLLAPLLCLAGAATQHWLSSLRVARPFFVALIITTAANVWLMGGFYYHQKQRVEHGAVFVPGFWNLESLYQSLKARAGAGRSVQIDDSEYLAALAHDDQIHRDATLIRRYIVVREKQAALKTGGGPPEPVLFKLCSSEGLNTGDDKIAYLGYGIALVQ